MRVDKIVSRKLKLAILISGSGSNLQSIIDNCNEEKFPAEILLVISNKADAYGLERATKAGIRNIVINHKDFSSREDFDTELDKAIIESGADFVCLAGFMRLLTADFTKKWEGKMINIHPSLLPDFKGANAHRDVIKAGVKKSGCTVHYVTPEMDAGPIILQKEVDVLENDTEETLAKRVLEAEHICYPEAIKKICE